MSGLLAGLLAAVACATAIRPNNIRDNQRRASRSRSFAWAIPVVLALTALGPLGAVLTFAITRFVRKWHQERILSKAPVPDYMTVCDSLAIASSAGLSVVEALQALSDTEGAAEARWARSVLTLISLGSSVSEAVRIASTEFPDLEPVVRAVTRSEITGTALSPLLTAIARRGRAVTRDRLLQRVRSLSVRSVLPLGLCFLPAFLLLAVVPLAVSFALGLPGA